MRTVFFVLSPSVPLAIVRHWLPELFLAKKMVSGTPLECGLHSPLMWYFLFKIPGNEHFQTCINTETVAECAIVICALRKPASH